MQKLLQVVLSAWREADRVVSERPEGSTEREAAIVASERLRDLYADLLAHATMDQPTSGAAEAEGAA